MAAKSVSLIGVASDLGANISGAQLGPAAIRLAGLHSLLLRMGLQVEDLGDIEVPYRELLSAQEKDKQHLGIIAEACARLYKLTMSVLAAKSFPVILGGDHSIALGSIAATAGFQAQQKKKLGVVWFDAHTDINTPESSISKNIHGMPVSVLLGKGYPELTSIGGQMGRVEPAHVVLVGLRDVDPLEKQLCEEMGVICYAMDSIDRKGMSGVMDEIVNHHLNSVDSIHVSFDLDGMDPHEAPGVSTPVLGGLSYREAHYALEVLADTRKLCALDMVELNPLNDDMQKTARLAVGLIGSALGKKIF